MTAEQRSAIGVRLLAAYEQLHAVAGRYIDSQGGQRVHLGKALRTALQPPAEADVYLVDDNPIVTFWGLATQDDRNRPKDLAQWRAMLLPQSQPACKPVPVVSPESVVSLHQDPVVPSRRQQSVLAPSARQPIDLLRSPWLWGMLIGSMLLLALYGLGSWGSPSTRAAVTAPVSNSVAEPSPEQQAVADQEFAVRMAEVGARSGEITVTLLWNNRNDLDLIIHCPSGEKLYYQKPSRCGGRLDVDKNAANELTLRPVENINWPRAAPPGSYQVLVHYYARKDQSVRPQTAFQLRLLHSGEARLYNGRISPNESKLVTRFTVVR